MVNRPANPISSAASFNSTYTFLVWVIERASMFISFTYATRCVDLYNSVPIMSNGSLRLTYSKEMFKSIGSRPFRCLSPCIVWIIFVSWFSICICDFVSVMVSLMGISNWSTILYSISLSILTEVNQYLVHGNVELLWYFQYLLDYEKLFWILLGIIRRYFLQMIRFNFLRYL